MHLPAGRGNGGPICRTAQNHWHLEHTRFDPGSCAFLKKQCQLLYLKQSPCHRYFGAVLDTLIPEPGYIVPRNWNHPTGLVHQGVLEPFFWSLLPCYRNHLPGYGYHGTETSLFWLSWFINNLPGPGFHSTGKKPFPMLWLS
jgi:hypothetical protein